VWPLLLLAVLLAFAEPAAAEQRTVVLENGDLTNWESKAFRGTTNYSTIAADERAVVKAVSRDGAAGMFRKITIDLTKTPYLHWRWRVDNTLQGNDERSKDGDDYPARVYVVISGGLLFWRTRAINYVWSAQQPLDSVWPNAFTSHAQMIAVRSGSEQVGQWLDETRNVRDDLRRVFGSDITQIDAVAFMSDTDNTGQTATAYYGDIYFSNTE
jgi:hypothetical protein